MLLRATLLLIFPLLFSESALGYPDDRQRTALAAIFDDVQAEEAALAIVERARHLPDEGRFRLLAEWVLPNANHTSLRLAAEFSPTGGYESPTKSNGPTNSGMRLLSGGNIVSPAAELINVAVRLNRLPQIRAEINNASRATKESRIARLAGLAMADCAAGLDGKAKEAITTLYQLVSADSDIDEMWLEPLLLSIQAGSAHHATSDAAADLSYYLLQNQIGAVLLTDWKSVHRHLIRLAEKSTIRTATNGVLKAEQRSASEIHPRNIRSHDNGLTQWNSGTLMTASSCASGHPSDVWYWDGEAVSKVSGHRKDHLYFQSPLRGNYEIEFDASAGTWQNTHLIIGGFWAGAGNQQRYMRGTLDNPSYTYVPFRTLMTKFRSTMRYRVVVRDREVDFYGNGRFLEKVRLRAHHDPWVAFGRLTKNSIRISNVRITGEPKIPDQISLSISNDLMGWIDYHNESIGSRVRGTRNLRHSNAHESGGIVSTPPLTDLENAVHQERLTYYHRPMFEDGTIEYEFQYKKQRRHTHPALGRTVFLLQPDGVAVHEVTNGPFDRSALAPDNILIEPQHRRGPERLPLRADDSNQLRMTVSGDTIDLYLNDVHVFQRPIEPDNQRQFGLFHYADRSQVDVRNVVWRGHWPKELPSISEQELPGDETEFLNERLPQMTARFTHTFDNYNPDDVAFSTPSTLPNEVIPGPAGLVVTRRGPAKAYESSIVEAELGASGDFDIRMSFDAFETDLDENNGSANVYLQVAIDDAAQTELNMRRRHSLQRTGNEHSHRAYGDYAQRRSTGTRRDGVAYLPTEATSGTIRIARRGNMAYSMWAEGDSDDFRIVSTQEVGTADTKPGGIRLRLLTYGNSGLSVRFKKLDVRAEKLFGPAVEGAVSPEVVLQLNKLREQLPVGKIYNFTKGSLSKDFRRSGDVAVAPDPNGLILKHVGTEPWQASSIMLRPSITGDLDITFSFQLTEIINPEAGRQSWVYMKAYLNDEMKHQPGIIFEQTAPDVRGVFARMGRIAPDRRTRYEILRRVRVDESVSLRLARYGDTAYFLTRRSPDEPETIITKTQVPIDPIRALWLFVHSGGEGRETHAVFKSLKVNAESIDGTN